MGSFQNESHVIVINQNFNLVSLTSITRFYLVRLLFEAMVLFYPIHLTPYIFDPLLSMQLEGIFGCSIYLYFVHLSRNEVYDFLSIIR